MSRRTAGLLLGLELALGLVLRLIDAGARPIWYDDAFSVFLSRGNLASIVRGTAADTMPPLYYFLLHLWMTLTSSIAGWRLLGALLGVATIAAAFALALRLFDVRVALVTGFFVAVSPLQIYQAQELRMYTLMTLGLALYAWGVAEAWQSPQARRLWPWAIVVVGGLVAAYSHNLAVFTLIAPDAFFLAKRQWGFLRRLLLAQLVMGILMIPWLVVVPGQIAKIQAAFWTPRPGVLEVLQALLLFHGYLPLPAAGQVVLLTASLMAVVLTAFVLMHASEGEGVGFLVVLLAVPPLLLFVASYVMRPVFVPRAFMTSALAYLMLAAAAVVRAKAAVVRFALAGCILLAAAVSLPAQYAYRSFPRSPFAGAAGYLESQVGPGAVVVHDNKLSYFPTAVYAPQLEQSFLPDEPGSHNDTLAPATQKAMGIFPASDLESAVRGASTVYFVVFQRAIDEYKAGGAADHPQLIWLRHHYSQEQLTRFGDLLVYVFSN
ncbi:MAG TPA: glycosyltransferase family 39 protein [Anaerolineales bacterium]|nr:glycosyltransferase family 39 protein [Anaerolineales bacterium]